MSHRSFNVRKDAAAVVAAQWLAPGERIVWIDCERQRFEMPRRTPEGKLKRPLPVRILLWTIGFPIMVVLFFAAEGDVFDNTRTGAARVIVFGEHHHCRASAAARRRNGFWVLTTHRLAYLDAVPLADDGRSRLFGFPSRVRKALTFADLPVEPVRLAAAVEVPRHEVSERGNLERRVRGANVPSAIYERFVLPDGSGVDFWRGHAPR